ncbi:MAG TPA: hypothetical protein DIS68_03045 [Lachnospiraceae bacterium]|nr:hypothetical protein [Lachnospiraceae bacterium]MBQ9568005.1 hypothetical protein [Lachnospiraceae bacterium]MCR4786077.1 hypothetical protein [Lachnospiraceae bacterium]HBB59851.1 hypothetical protein [Lachnospiraceae bacterium]HCR99767.1 hypothetical protein [Lachnospiraceae bacterium]
MTYGMTYDDSQFELMMRLGRFQKNGIPIFFEGKPCTPRDVVNIMMVREDEVYMPDYVTDKDDKVVQIRYDHVK